MKCKSSEKYHPVFTQCTFIPFFQIHATEICLLKVFLHVFFFFLGCIFLVSKTQGEVFSDAFQHNRQSKGCKMLPKLELILQSCRVSLSSALGPRYFQSNRERMHDTQHSGGNVGFLGNGAGGDHKLPGRMKPEIRQRIYLWC